MLILSNVLMHADAKEIQLPSLEGMMKVWCGSFIVLLLLSGYHINCIKTVLW